MAIAQDPSPVVHPCKHSLVPIALPFLPDSARFAVPQICWTKAFHNIDKALKQSIQNAQRTFQGFSTNNPFFQLLTHVHRQFHVTVQGFCTQQRQRVHVANCKFAAILPGDSVAGLVVSNGISNFLNIYSTVLIVRLVLTWFPNAPPAIVSPLSTICDPYLNIFRGIIPPLGGTIDLSPILAFFVLNALTSTAAALPAELPEYMKNTSSTKTMSSMYGSSTRSQNLWLKCQLNLFRASKKRSQS